jgi:hypothetical protein
MLVTFAKPWQRKEATMTDKKKPHTAGTGTASKTTFDSRNFIKSDPLLGWLSLGASVKQSRNERQKKRGWKRDSRGRIDPALAAQLALLAVVFLLFVGGVAA